MTIVCSQVQLCSVREGLWWIYFLGLLGSREEELVLLVNIVIGVWLIFEY